MLAKEKLGKASGLLAGLLLQNLLLAGSAFASTTSSYIATGMIGNAGLLEIYEYDDNTGEETQVDGFVTGRPFSTPMSFTLRFDVDESVDGRIPLFANFSVFDSAASAISLDVGGSPFWSGGPATVTQFPQQLPPNDGFPARWSWSTSNGIFNSVGPITAVVNSTFEEINLVPQDVDLRLYDSSGMLYDGTNWWNQLITLDESQFDDMVLSVSWYTDIDQEPDFGDVYYDAYYSELATITSLSKVSSVPLPAAVWLLGSGLIGLLVSARRRSGLSS